jgi:hypothetical protein
MMDQLWACLSAGLKRSAQGDRLREVGTEVLLLAGIKRVAVRVQSTLINQVKFLSLGQEQDEPVGNYLGRLQGEAAQFNFVVTCTNCDHETSYEDKLLTHELVRGLVDPVIQEKVLTHASDGKKLSLKEVLAIAEAQ